MQQLIRDCERERKANSDTNTTKPPNFGVKSSPSGEERAIGPYRILMKENLGKGTTGTVKLALRWDPQKGDYVKAAVKIVDKTVTRKKKEARNEIKLLQALKNDYIIPLKHLEEDQFHVYIFTPFYNHTDLYSYIQLNGIFSESMARKLFSQMLKSIQYLHSMQICHHDVKLDNFVMNNDYQIKLIDFGFAVEMSSVGNNNGPTPALPMKVFDTSLAYSPLEILSKRPHDESVDIFSLGVCLFYMLIGRFPFCEPHKTSFEELCKNVQTCTLMIPKEISTHAQDLLVKMLALRQNRISLLEIFAHPWLKLKIY